MNYRFFFKLCSGLGTFPAVTASDSPVILAHLYVGVCRVVVSAIESNDDSEWSLEVVRILLSPFCIFSSFHKYFICSDYLLCVGIEGQIISWSGIPVEPQPGNVSSPRYRQPRDSLYGKNLSNVFM